MSEPNGLVLFEEKYVRRLWNEKDEKWYFSVVDVCAVLTDQPNQRGATLYWSKLKQRLREENSELLTICQQMLALLYDALVKMWEVNTEVNEGE